MIQVVGHKNPDTDSICSALAMTEFLKARGLEAKATCQGALNFETKFILEYAGVEAPELYQTGTKGKVWLVDYSDVAQAPDDINEVEIVGIVDHHRLGDVTTELPLEAWIWPVGCSCTIIYSLYRYENVEITKPLALLMLSAIVSDTVGFASPTCTDKDRQAVAELAKIAELDDVDAYIQKVLIAKTDINGLTVEQLVEKDLKGYVFNGRNVEVGQLELATLSQVEEQLEALNEALRARQIENDLALCALMLTDITTATTKMLYQGEWSEKLDPHAKDGELTLENTLSRKKQGWPWLQQVLK